MNITFHFKNYIASPYWPELNVLINVTKGIHPKLGPAKRDLAIAANLEKMGLTAEDHEKLKEKVKEKWYKDANGKIYIPRHQIAGCLVNCIKHCPKQLRGEYNTDSFRALVQISDFATEKTKCDGIFARYVKGQESNQRRYQEDEYIENFAAVGEFTLSQQCDDKALKRLLEYAMTIEGIGSCRVMGYGRGTVVAV